MSALAGIFMRESQREVDPREMRRLAQSLARLGSDGGGERRYQSVAMAYRAFHTTPESHFETQPYLRDGIMLTWDGRLDNREELLARSDHGCLSKTPTDLELAAGAYQSRGVMSFAELIGDWAIAIWDGRLQQLILARDCFGVRRLFYRVEPTLITWCTAIEPLVQATTCKLNLDLDYLAGCIHGRPPMEATAYREIRSVIPGSFITFDRRKSATTSRYWSLPPIQHIRYSSDSEYEEEFRHLFADAVRRRLRSDRPVLAELSGGLDSSSIVCVADAIRANEPGVPIQTVSYYDPSEPGGDERRFFSLVEKMRGRTGHHISISEFDQRVGLDCFRPLPEAVFAASPGHFKASVLWDERIAKIQESFRARVILSGLGGDEVLGGIQYGAPEIAEGLLRGDLVSFMQSLLRWSVARRRPVTESLYEVFELLKARYRPQWPPSMPSQPRWMRVRPSERHQSFRSFSSWRELSPSMIHMERMRYSLASQLTFTEPPLTGSYERRYPFLDRSLFVFLASIPRTQVLQADHRRHLMRRALRDTVPPEILLRRTKWFGARSVLAQIQEHSAFLHRLIDEDWLSQGLVVDKPMLKEYLDEIEHGTAAQGFHLLSAIGVEYWLRSQAASGTTDVEQFAIGHSQTASGAIQARATSLRNQVLMKGGKSKCAM